VVATVDGIAIVAAVTVVVTVDGSDIVVAAATVVVIVYDSVIFVVVTVTVVVTVDGSGIVASASVAVVSVGAVGEEQMNVTSDWRHCCSYSLFASRYVFVIVPVGKIGKRNCCLDV
jgi:hypothetical protein